MARLIKTEKEVEGRYEETWVVVEEDVLDQWPEGPLEVVGRDAPRKDGLERARGHARYTADVQLNGMLHAAVLRSPYARARVQAARPRAARARAPGVHAVVGPGDVHVLTDEPSIPATPVAAVAADTSGRRAAALKLIDVEWEPLEPLLDPDEAVAREQLVDEPRRYERGDLERGLAEADVVVEAEYRTQTVLHNSMETHQSICRWLGEDKLEVWISTQYIWGVRDALARQLGLPPGRRARRLRVHGRRLRLEERAGRLHLHRRRAREAQRAAGAAARSRAARRTRPPATATPPSSGSSPARSPTAR